MVMNTVCDNMRAHLTAPDSLIGIMSSQLLLVILEKIIRSARCLTNTVWTAS